MKTSETLFFRISLLAGIICAGILLSTCNSSLEKREYGWFDFAVKDLDTSQNAVDLSFLNEKEAGVNGFVTVNNGHFIKGNGERIRFFGDNLTFGRCFPDKETAIKIAGSLRKKGMNVIRFHHMDMNSAPNGIWNQAKDDLDPGQLDKLDWLIYQLKIHGIYCNLNTHVSFTYPGADYEGIGAFNFGKGIDNFYRPYIDMQKSYAKKLLMHLNPYTGNTYANEPAVAFVEVNNENSIISRWNQLPKLKDIHKKALLQLWNTWLGSNDKYRRIQAGGKDPLWIIAHYEDQATAIQQEMMWAFLVKTEVSYAKEMIDYYKNVLKIHALVTDSQDSYSGMAGVLRESEYADFIDMHAYWEHPRFPGRPWSRTDWLIRNSSMVSDKEGGALVRFGQHRVDGMPLTISEYDHPAPSFFSAEMYPMLNSVSAFQDFDAIYHFDYGGPYDQGRIENYFATAGHPLKQIFIPVGTVLFRMGAIQPGTSVVQLDLPPASVVDQLVKHGPHMNRSWEEAGATPSLIVRHQMNVLIGGNELKLTGPANDLSGGPWTSDTGEIVWDNRDSAQAVFTVNTPMAKVAVGYIGGKSLDLGEVTIAMDTTPANWATITLTALDGNNLENSTKVLLVAAGRVENTDMVWDENKKSVHDQWGTSLTRAEGIPALISLRDMKKFMVQSLDSIGNPEQEIRVRQKGNEQTFGIGAQYKTLWYLISR